MRRLALLLTALLTAGLLTAAPAVAAAPTIRSFSPASGTLNTPVAITGTGFTGRTGVRFGGVAASVVSVQSSTRIVAKVPLTAPSGPISVTAIGGTATSRASFTVNPGVFTSPQAVGPPTSTRTVYFSGFGADEQVDVNFDSTPLSLGSADANGAGNVVITVPRTATPGTHTIEAIGRRSRRTARGLFTVRTDWPQYGYTPAHRATNPFENVLGAANVDQLGTAWHADRPEPGAILSTPAVVGGVVYEGFTDGTVAAFDETTGAQKWTFAIGGEVYSSPAVVNGSLYIGSEDGGLYALNAATGALRWRLGTPAPIRIAPVVYGSTVYAANTVGNVYAVDAASGLLQWLSNSSSDSPIQSLAVSNALAYFTRAPKSGGSDVYALDAATGDDRWILHNSSVVNDLVVSGPHVYFGDTDGVVSSVDAATGASTWSHALGNSVGGLAVGYGRVFAVTYRAVTALVDSSGAGVWSISYLRSPHPMSLANGLLYVSGAGSTLVLGVSNGAAVGSFGVGGVGPAVVVDGTLTVGGATDDDVGELAHLTLPSAATPDPTWPRPDHSLHRQD